MKFYKCRKWLIVFRFNIIYSQWIILSLLLICVVILTAMIIRRGGCIKIVKNSIFWPKIFFPYQIDTCNRIERLHSCDYEFWARVWPGWRSNQIIVAEGSFQTTILNGVGRGHEGSDQTTGNKPFSDETGSTNAIEFYINSLRMRLMLLHSQESHNWETKSKNRKIAFSRYINEIFIHLFEFTILLFAAEVSKCVNSYFQLKTERYIIK